MKQGRLDMIEAPLFVEEIYLKAEIISIGTELLMGELTDTNAAWIATRLPALGIQLRWVSIVGDNLDMLSEAFSRGLERSDIIFTTGGLGPTQDDLTREGVAAALGRRLRSRKKRLGTWNSNSGTGEPTCLPATSNKPN